MFELGRRDFVALRLAGVVAGHGEVVELEKRSGRYSLGIT